MTNEELRHELYKKNTECDTLRTVIEAKEREFLRREAELLKESSRSNENTRALEKIHYEQKEQLLTNYHQKKVRKSFINITSIVHMVKFLI